MGATYLSTIRNNMIMLKVKMTLKGKMIMLNGKMIMLKVIK